MKMGTAQKQNISVQHRQWNRTSEPTKARNPVTFERWFLICLRKCEKKGAEFTFLLPELVRIQWPEQVPMLRTREDFEREYYLSLIHISEPTRLGMISYAVFCLKKKKK